MSDEGAEKVAEASPDKEARARRKGDVPISSEANTAAGFAGFLLSLTLVGGPLQRLGSELFALFLNPEATASALLRGVLLGDLIRGTVSVLVPIVILPALAVLIAMGVQQGIVVAPQRIKPDLKKISPVAGAGKKFGPQALLEFLKNAMKISVLTVASGIVLWFEARRSVFAFQADATALPTLLVRELTVFLGLALAVAVVFAIVDLPIIRTQRQRRLRMSQQEVRDEAKENEGDGQIKSQRRQRAEKIALSRMLSDVQHADVLITNPTHFAVALQWKREGDHLPTCVAKGTDEIALRLRSAARDAGVPIRDDPPTARALHATLEIGDPIRQDHFAAVAAAIRFADRARAKRR